MGASGAGGMGFGTYSSSHGEPFPRLGSLMLQADEAASHSLQLRALMIKAGEEMDDPDTSAFGQGFDGRTGGGVLNAAKAVGLARD